MNKFKVRDMFRILPQVDVFENFVIAPMGMMEKVVCIFFNEGVEVKLRKTPSGKRFTASWK